MRQEYILELLHRDQYSAANRFGDPADRFQRRIALAVFKQRQVGFVDPGALFDITK
jgi:hypothetical protein